MTGTALSDGGRPCLLVYKPPDGGVADHVMRLALGLPEHGWDPWVVGPPESMIYPALDDAGIPVTRVDFQPGYGKLGADLSALRGVISVLRRRRFDVVHAHSPKAALMTRLAAPFAKGPLVYTPNCFSFMGPWGWPRRTFSTATERSVGGRVDALICVAESERRMALEHAVADPEKLRVIFNATPPCPGSVEPDPELERFAAGGPLAACITVLRPQKTVDVFIDAAPTVLERVPDARLAVVGDGELRGQLEDRARGLGLDPERFAFFDFLPPPARQLASLDLFVLPSAWEGLPIGLLEAMACGVPQVATSVGGSPEAVADGETGLVCPPHDPPALADCLIALLSDPERRERMSRASRERHARLFGVEQMVGATARLYDELARPG